MDEPIIELPQKPTPAQLLQAATDAHVYAKQLQREADRWRAMSEGMVRRAHARIEERIHNSPDLDI